MRAFFSIDPDEPIRHAANKIIEQRPFSHMRWTKPENLHLTLRFLGSLPEDQLVTLIEKVQQSISDVKPFIIETNGTFCFPKEHPHIFAINFKLTNELAELTKIIHDTTHLLGFPEENRPFLPHLTLGRFKSPPKEKIENLLETNLTLKVDTLQLYRSEPTHEGSQYTILHHFNFT